MPALGGVNSTTSVATSAELAAHTDDATAAHAASAIAFTPAGTVAATTVQAAIEEVAAEASGSGIPQGGPLTEPLDADGNAIIGLPDPTDPQDAATKASSEAYTDAAEDNLSAFLYIRRAIVDLEAADIATLSSVPVQVVAAPGAGKVIVPVAASFQYKAGTVGFTLNGTIPSLFVGSALKGSFGPFDLDELTSEIGSWVDMATTGTQAGQANAALLLIADVDPDGAGDGTARLTVLYYVMDLAV